jgi:replication factor C subunit 2/4
MNKNTSLPWVDKYRPKKLKDVVEQKEIVDVLMNTIKMSKSGDDSGGNLPHLLLCGPPGTGKTSTILASAYELFGPKIFDERVLELNASDERGINIVRDKITRFAKSAIGTADPDYPCPPFKLIILDEADAMTNEAQSALRKIMEEYSKITRFCFICNYTNQIIDPIISRCMKFRFKPIKDDNLINRLKLISFKENMILNDDVYDAIRIIVKGDARRAIMILQNLQYFYKIDINITKDHVYQISGYVPYDEAKKYFKKCIKKETKISDIYEIAHELKCKAYPLSSIMEQVNNFIIRNDSINDKYKSLIAIELSMTEKRLLDGADEFLQLFNLLSFIKMIINGSVLDIKSNII